MAKSIKEIGKKAEALIEQGKDADKKVQSCQARVASSSSRVAVARRQLAAASETDEEGNPRGNVDAARAQLSMAQNQLAASQRALSSAQSDAEHIRQQKNTQVREIEKHNQVEKSNLDKLKQLRSSAFGSDARALTEGMASRLNEAEDSRVALLRSMGIDATPEYISTGEDGGSVSTWKGGNFSALDTAGSVKHYEGGSSSSSDGSASGKGIITPLGGGLGNLISSIFGGESNDNTMQINVEEYDNKQSDVQEGRIGQSILNKLSHQDAEADKRWNEEYFPLVEANIRSSVDRLFTGYIAPEKVNESIEKLSFMGQSGLKKKYGEGFQKGTLGFNDGNTSNIAHDIKQPSLDGRVGTQNLQGSGGTNINYAFVTAVHESFHMMSANDTPDCRRRGLMVGNDEVSRAMNEAFTEYFTYLSCGGDQSLGGLYPGVYSGYHSIMQEMPILEKAVGRDCMMEAYFHNNPGVLRAKVDGLLEEGAWDNMCAGAYALLYSPSMIDNQLRLSQYFERLKVL